jgi:hypothetical protein
MRKKPLSKVYLGLDKMRESLRQRMKANKDINELIAKFYDAKMSLGNEDITAGERIFKSNPAQLPSYVLSADIKEVMFAAVQKNRQHTYRLICQYAAAAAVIIVVFGAGITLLHKPTQQIQTTAASLFWQDNLSSVETTIDAQFAQLESSEPDSTLLTLESNVSAEMKAISDITSELDDTDRAFWKG